MHLPSTLHLHLQASTPSSQLCPTLLLPAPPQFLYQAPPGAQQLARPDFVNVPQFAQLLLAEVMPELVSALMIGVLAFPHCANHLPCDDALQTVRDIDPEQSLNMST